MVININSKNEAETLILFLIVCFSFRFKVHVIVMDDTGSTTFVLFDRIVTQIVGRNVKDLIDEMSKVSTCLKYNYGSLKIYDALWFLTFIFAKVVA